MKLTCPSCGAAIDFDQAVAGTDGEALAKAGALFGPDWEQVSEYVDGFRARRGAALPLKKRLRLLREVWEMWRECRFQFDGQEYVVGREEFRAALAQVANRELTGLKNHNYLKQVLKGAAREYGKRLEAVVLEQEARLRAGVRSGKNGPGTGDRGPGQDFETDPEIPKLVQAALFGRTKEEKQAAKQKLEALRGKKT